METQTEHFKGMDKSLSKQWQLELGAYVRLMGGIEKGFEQISDIVNRSWDGNSWNGTDTELDMVITNTKMLILAAGMLQATVLIKDAHQVYTEGLEKYLEFVVYIVKGKPQHAEQQLCESNRLLEKAITMVNAIWNQLGFS